MDSFSTVVTDLGFPIVAAGCLAYAIYRAAQWFATRILEPVAGAAIALMQELRGAIVKQGEMLNTICDMLSEHALVLQQVVEMMKQQKS